MKLPKIVSSDELAKSVDRVLLEQLTMDDIDCRLGDTKLDEKRTP
jgi:hypothetical protein